MRLSRYLATTRVSRAGGGHRRDRGGNTADYHARAYGLPATAARSTPGKVMATTRLGEMRHLAIRRPARPSAIPQRRSVGACVAAFGPVWDQYPLRHCRSDVYGCLDSQLTGRMLV